MNKKQIAKRTKRNQVSKQKKKQSNINKTKKKKAAAARRDRVMEYFINASKAKQKEVLKNMNNGEQ